MRSKCSLNPNTIHDILLPITMATDYPREKIDKTAPAIKTDNYYKGLHVYESILNHGNNIKRESNSNLIKKYVSPENRIKDSSGTWMINEKGVSEYLEKYNLMTFKTSGGSLLVTRNTYKNGNMKIK